MTTQKQPRMFQSDPPMRHHKSPESITTVDALRKIQAYLESAQTCPYLHPDATFSERHGPTCTGLASEGGLVLHQLRRVEAGLRGKILAAEPEFAGLPSITPEITDAQEPSFGTGNESPSEEGGGGDDGALDAIIVAAQKRRLQELREAGQLPYDELNEGVPDGSDVRDWTDRSYNEQMLEQGEQGIVEGEIGVRNNVVSQEVPRPARKRKIEEIVEHGSPPMDKEARKRAKRERQRQEQRTREESRQQKAKKKKKSSSSEATGEEGNVAAKDATKHASFHETLQADEARSIIRSRKENKEWENRSDSKATESMESSSRLKKKSETPEEAGTSQIHHNDRKKDQDIGQHFTETDASSLGRMANGISPGDTLEKVSRKRTETVDERRARKKIVKKIRTVGSNAHEGESLQGSETRPAIHGEESIDQQQNSKNSQDKAKRKDEKKRKNDESWLGSSLNRQPASPEL